MSLGDKKKDRSLGDRKKERALAGAPRIVAATVALMEDLTRVLMDEIDVVTKRKKEEHALLLKKKQRLAVDYRANMRVIAADPALLKALPDDAKAVLRETAKGMAEAADTNARALRAAVSATRQLIQNIMAMVRSETKTVSAYKNHTKAHLELGCYSPTCRPVAVSRTV